ncbi:hypothetical protein C7E17_19400, partial [Stenotrophomonas maltophilia]
AAAVPELAHSVHVEVNGLRPGRDYYYRFACDGVRGRRPGHAPAGAAWRRRGGARAGAFGARGGQWPAPRPRLLLPFCLRR